MIEPNSEISPEYHALEFDLAPGSTNPADNPYSNNALNPAKLDDLEHLDTDREQKIALFRLELIETKGIEEVDLDLPTHLRPTESSLGSMVASLYRSTAASIISTGHIALGYITLPHL